MTTPDPTPTPTKEAVKLPDKLTPFCGALEECDGIGPTAKPGGERIVVNELWSDTMPIAEVRGDERSATAITFELARRWNEYPALRRQLAERDATIQALRNREVGLCQRCGAPNAAAELERLREVVGEAADDIEHWGGYASEYFQQKWGLAGHIAKYRAAASNPQQQQEDASAS